MILRVLPEASEEAQAVAERYELKKAGLGVRFTEALSSAFDGIVKNP